MGGILICIFWIYYSVFAVAYEAPISVQVSESALEKVMNKPVTQILGKFIQELPSVLPFSIPDFGIWPLMMPGFELFVSKLNNISLTGANTKITIMSDGEKKIAKIVVQIPENSIGVHTKVKKQDGSETNINIETTLKQSSFEVDMEIGILPPKITNFKLAIGKEDAATIDKALKKVVFENNSSFTSKVFSTAAGIISKSTTATNYFAGLYANSQIPEINKMLENNIENTLSKQKNKANAESNDPLLNILFSSDNLGQGIVGGVRQRAIAAASGDPVNMAINSMQKEIYSDEFKSDIYQQQLKRSRFIGQADEKMPIFINQGNYEKVKEYFELRSKAKTERDYLLGEFGRFDKVQGKTLSRKEGSNKLINIEEDETQQATAPNKDPIDLINQAYKKILETLKSDPEKKEEKLSFFILTINMLKYLSNDTQVKIALDRCMQENMTDSQKLASCCLGNIGNYSINQFDANATNRDLSKEKIGKIWDSSNKKINKIQEILHLLKIYSTQESNVNKDKENLLQAAKSNLEEFINVDFIASKKVEPEKSVVQKASTFVANTFNSLTPAKLFTGFGSPVNTSCNDMNEDEQKEDVPDLQIKMNFHSIGKMIQNVINAEGGFCVKVSITKTCMNIPNLKITPEEQGEHPNKYLKLRIEIPNINVNAKTGIISPDVNVAFKLDINLKHCKTSMLLCAQIESKELGVQGNNLSAKILEKLINVIDITRKGPRIKELLNQQAGSLINNEYPLPEAIFGRSNSFNFNIEKDGVVQVTAPAIK